MHKDKGGVRDGLVLLKPPPRAVSVSTTQAAP